MFVEYGKYNFNIAHIVSVRIEKTYVNDSRHHVEVATTDKRLITIGTGAEEEMEVERSAFMRLITLEKLICNLEI